MSEKDACYKIDDIMRLIDMKMKIITFCGKFLSILNKIKNISFFGQKIAFFLSDFWYAYNVRKNYLQTFKKLFKIIQGAESQMKTKQKKWKPTSLSKKLTHNLRSIELI